MRLCNPAVVFFCLPGNWSMLLVVGGAASRSVHESRGRVRRGNDASVPLIKHLISHMKAEWEAAVAKTSTVLYNERRGCEAESQEHVDRLRGNQPLMGSCCAHRGLGQSEPRSVKQQSARKSSIPGRCSQRCDPRLEYPHEEREWVFFDDHKIYEREEDTAVDDETHDHGYHVHAQLPGNHLQVSDGDDLSTDEASDTQRGVPAGRQVHVHCRSSSGRG